MSLASNIELSFDIDFLWRYSKNDALYGPGGQILRSGADGDSRYVTTQYETVLEVEWTDHLSGSASYTIMPAGPFIKESGPSKTTHFIGLETMYIY